MNKRLVIDSTVYLVYASYNKIYRLIDAIGTYNLIVYVNEELLSEVFKNLPKVLRVKDVKPGDILEHVKIYTLQVSTIPRFTNSPDPKDNFLFDIALQTRSEVIVTQEKALIGFTDSPVPIHDLKWFKETYPVDL